MKARHRWFCGAAAAALLSLGGCAGLAGRGEPPQLTLIDLGLREVTLFAQRYALRLEVRNPNPFDVQIQGLACELVLNDQPFLAGVSGAEVTVPRYGRGTVEVDATGTLAGILRQAAQWEKGAPPAFRYRLTGHLNLVPGGRVPFDQGGEVTLPVELLRK